MVAWYLPYHTMVRLVPFVQFLLFLVAVVGLFGLVVVGFLRGRGEGYGRPTSMFSIRPRLVYIITSDLVVFHGVASITDTVQLVPIFFLRSLHSKFSPQHWNLITDFLSCLKKVQEDF